MEPGLAPPVPRTRTGREHALAQPWPSGQSHLRQQLPATQGRAEMRIPGPGARSQERYPQSTAGPASALLSCGLTSCPACPPSEHLTPPAVTSTALPVCCPLPKSPPHLPASPWHWAQPPGAPGPGQVASVRGPPGRTQAGGWLEAEWSRGALWGPQAQGSPQPRGVEKLWGVRGPACSSWPRQHCIQVPDWKQTLSHGMRSGQLGSPPTSGTGTGTHRGPGGTERRRPTWASQREISGSGSILTAFRKHQRQDLLCTSV